VFSCPEMCENTFPTKKMVPKKHNLKVYALNLGDKIILNVWNACL
jgi:hypothetical protein